MFAQRATVLALAFVAISTSIPVAEAGGRHDGGWNYREPDRHSRHQDRHSHSHRSHRDHSGAALGAGLLFGASLLWLAQQPSPPPQRVVVMPPPAHVVVTPSPMVVSPPAPRYASPPTEVWYYCRSSGAYYPYVPTCITPWELVPVQ